MEERPLRVGDRVEWIGPTAGPLGAALQHGERGWVVMIDPKDDIITWDHCGTESGDFTNDRYVRRVGDRYEPDPEKWLPGDPFGRGG